MAKVKWCSCSQHQHGGRSSSKAVQQWLVFVKALHKWMSLKARKSFNIYRVIYLVIKFIKVPLSWLGILHIYNIWNPVIRIAIYLVVWKFYLRGRFGCWRRANARNVRLYYPYWQYTDLFIFRFVSLLYLRSTLRLYLDIVNFVQDLSNNWWAQASSANASWYRLDGQSCCNLLVSRSVTTYAYRTRQTCTIHFLIYQSIATR